MLYEPFVGVGAREVSVKELLTERRAMERATHSSKQVDEPPGGSTRTGGIPIRGPAKYPTGSRRRGDLRIGHLEAKYMKWGWPLSVIRQD